MPLLRERGRRGGFFVRASKGGTRLRDRDRDPEFCGGKPPLGESAFYSTSYAYLQAPIIFGQSIPVRGMRLSVITQSHHGIDARGATRGDIARSESDESQQDGDDRKRSGVRRLHIEKQGGHHAGERQGGYDADGDTQECEFCAIGNYELENVT